MPFMIGVGLGLLLTPLARVLGIAVGLVDRPGQDALKIHREPVSVLGGVAVVGSALGAAAWSEQALGWTVTASAAAALLTGLADDVWSLPPWARVALLTASSAVLLAGGTGLELNGSAGWAGLILLVLVCTNAVNIVDGQDGLAGGLALISALGLTGVAWLQDDPSVGLGLALAGALGAFLVWNRPPAARIFLGNNGAYGLGVLLAVLAARAVAVGGVRSLLAAGACLGPFAFEVVFTVARRARARARVAGGDRLHSYDLVAGATGRTASTITFWALGVLSASLGLLIQVAPLAAGIPIGGLAALGAASWGVALWGRRHLRNPEEKPYVRGRMARQRARPTLEYQARRRPASPGDAQTSDR
jgi:UDP-GlcNAc:undecaprenyl-phosphate/decaprenyl-phosphate GlcNAc-1-phosphate transferase